MDAVTDRLPNYLSSTVTNLLACTELKICAKNLLGVEMVSTFDCCLPSSNFRVLCMASENLKRKDSDKKWNGTNLSKKTKLEIT